MTRETRPDVEGLLSVVRAPHGAGPLHEEPEAASPDPATTARERFIALDGQGRVTGYNGHVDLGTGIRTALAQIVAEELDVAVGSVDMVLGHTGLAPNQGGTIASETIQVTAVPLRQAAACARAYLVGEAANLWGLPATALTVDDGVIRAPAPDNRFVVLRRSRGGPPGRPRLRCGAGRQGPVGLSNRGPPGPAHRHRGQGDRHVQLCA